MLSVTERAVYGASTSSVPRLFLNPKIVGSLVLKRPEGRAPTSRQLVDAPNFVCAGNFSLPKHIYLNTLLDDGKVDSKHAC